MIAMDEQRMMFLLRQSLGETNATLSSMVTALMEIREFNAEAQAAKRTSTCAAARPSKVSTASPRPG
jgi:hypothetical protein